MLIAPHGGSLVDRVLPPAEAEPILARQNEFFILDIDDEKAMEVQNIACGVYSPLTGFLKRDDVDSILSEDRLSGGLPWTIPIVLDAPADVAGKLSTGQVILLRHQSRIIASLQVEDLFEWDPGRFARSVFQTEDGRHPGVQKLKRMADRLIGGSVHLLVPPFSQFPRYFLTPRETRILFKEKGWKTVVGFQTRNVPHLGHEYVQKTAMSAVDGLFINPVIGKKKAGDFTDGVILDSYRALIDHYYNPSHAVMAILQTEMRYAGPKEAIFHAVVRKNFGCSHFIIGRDHAGVGDYYHPFAAQWIFERFPDLEITPLFFMSFFYCNRCGSIANDKTCPHPAADHVDFAGKIIRDKLVHHQVPPESMMRREVAEEILKSANPFVADDAEH